MARETESESHRTAVERDLLYRWAALTAGPDRTAAAVRCRCVRVSSIADAWRSGSPAVAQPVKLGFTGAG